MRRCLQLAANGLATAAPNPMVGCVIVHNGQIIGEGFHIEPGGPHAEVHAVNSVKDPEMLRGSTLYVNLEPCSHHGRTPPCAVMIVKHDISCVVAGISDPYPEVAGRGFEILRRAGTDVITGVCAGECADLNRRFLTFHQKKRPYVILKWAQTIDGLIDKDRVPGESPHVNWITHPNNRILVHKWRSEEQAVMIGAATALRDNPSLTVREWTGRQPLRVVLDAKGELSPGLAVFDNNAPSIAFVPQGRSIHGVETVELNGTEEPLQQVLKELTRRNVLSILVEGGQRLLKSFIEMNLWDEARIFTGNKLFFKGIDAPRISSGRVLYTERLDNDTLTVLRNE